MQISSILKLLTAGTLCSGAIVGLQVYNSAIVIINHYDTEINPEPMPSTPWIGFWSGDGLQFVGFLLVLFFFRPKERDEMGNADSKTKQPEDHKERNHRHKKSHHSKRPRTGPPSPPRGDNQTPEVELNIIIPVSPGRSSDVSKPVNTLKANLEALDSTLPGNVPSLNPSSAPATPGKESELNKYMTVHLETEILPKDTKGNTGKSGNDSPRSNIIRLITHGGEYVPRMPSSAIEPRTGPSPLSPEGVIIPSSNDRTISILGPLPEEFAAGKITTALGSPRDVKSRTSEHTRDLGAATISLLPDSTLLPDSNWNYGIQLPNSPIHPSPSRSFTNFQSEL